MSIKKKIILILILTVIIVTVLIAYLSRILFLGGFINIEYKIVRQNIEVVKSALSKEIDMLKSNANDYGVWDETYYFVKGENNTYIKDNLADSVFENFRYNLILFYDLSGSLIYGRAYDYINKRELLLPAGIDSFFSGSKSLLAKADTMEAQAGIIVLPDVSLLLAVQPILNNSGIGPASGTLVFGQFLDNEEIRYLQDNTHLPVEITGFQEFREKFKDNKNILNSFLVDEIAIFKESSRNISGYSLINDIYNQPVLVASIILPRDIYNNGVKIINFLFIFTLLAAIIIIIIASLIIKKFVISRLTKLSANVKNISGIKDFSQKINISGSDEISSLADDINSMLITFNQSNKDLEISEKRFRDIGKNAQEWIWEVDKKGIFTFSNEAVFNILGHKPEEVIGKYLYRLASPEDAENFKNIIADALKNKKSFRSVIKKSWHKKTKETIWLSSSGVPIINENGDVIGLRGMEMDITEYKKAEQEIISRTSMIENQKQAILNILEDVSESEAELKDINDKLKKRSNELASLKVLGDELSSILDVDGIVETVNGYLYKAINSPIVTYLIINPFDERDILYKSCLNQEVSEKFIAASKDNLIHFIYENGGDNKEGIIKIIKTVNPQIIGAKLDNKNAVNLQNNLFFPLRVGDKNLGVISIALEKDNTVTVESQKLGEAIISSFVFAINHLYTLISTQHSKTISLVESLSDGIIMYNNNKDVILINPAVSKYTGFSKEYFNFNDFFKLFSGINFRLIINDSIKTGKMEHLNEIQILNKFYEMIVVPVRDNLKKIVGGAIIIHDITHIKQIDRMKTEFVSVASHQLRTPLTAIKLFTEMLMRGEVGDLLKEQKEYLDNIYQSTDRMVKLVNDLLNVTRIESGRLKIDPQPTNLSDFIKSIIAEAGPIAAIKKISIKYDMEDGEMPEIAIDRNLIQQVIHNLLTNAIRYTPAEKNSVDIALKKNKENYVISVSDYGIGIPPEAQGRIFEKFFRADNAVKTETEGTGLGLYVCKMIVESSGGKIWFESKIGKGTVFYVSLPMKGMERKEGERGLAIS
jgi:PAS domain S-box-containing protein